MRKHSIVENPQIEDRNAQASIVENLQIEDRNA